MRKKILPGDSDRSDIRGKIVGELASSHLNHLDEWSGEYLVTTALGQLEAAPNDPNAVAKISEHLPRFLPLMTLCLGIKETAESLQMVCSREDIGSSYVLARTLVERSINFSFLAVSSDADFDDWIAYSRQKAFRLLKRVQQAGSQQFGFGFSTFPDISNDPILKEALARFTGKRKGREVTRWTKRSLNDRLGVVENSFDGSQQVVAMLLRALAFVYDVGAEAQHGTFLGVALPLGWHFPSGIDKVTHLLIVRLTTVMSLGATLRVLCYIARWPERSHQVEEEEKKGLKDAQTPLKA